MLDLGVVGLISLILVLALMLRRVWVRRSSGECLPIIVLLAHASIDFDMSFGYYWLLLVSWVGLYSVIESAPGKIERPHLPPQKVLRHRYLIILAENRPILLAYHVFNRQRRIQLAVRSLRAVPQGGAPRPSGVSKGGRAARRGASA